MLYISKDTGIFRQIYNFYNSNILDISYFPFENIYYTDNIREDVQLFCTPTKAESLDNLAVTILPNDILDNMVILVEVSLGDFSNYAYSLIHELTHVYDFTKFSQQYYQKMIVDFSDISKHDLFETFRRWSEFHSYAYGEYYMHVFIDCITNANNLYEKKIIYKDMLKDYMRMEH